MPKTIRNQFDKYLTYEKLIEAHNKARKGKNRKPELIKFNLKQEEYIMWLYLQLKNGTYHHGGYVEFYVTEPKLRKIEKSRYIDRIVHTWLVNNFLIKGFVSQFIPTSFACLKGKGMHRAAFCVQDFMKKAKRKWNDYYIIKTDVAHYFDSIDKSILLKILQRKIKDPKLIWLIKEILYAQKREKGIEIGNYTSQIFANIYLNEVDQYIKHELKVKYYVRYLDDSILIVKNKEEAKIKLELIRQYLREKLKSVDIAKESKDLDIGELTLKDIVDELSKPGRDPRDEMPKPILRQDVLKFEDLKEGMILPGTVRNVIDFGAFVDIGVKYDGLVHISEMSDKYIKNPSELVSVGDIVKVKVIKIDMERHKVGLSMKI